MNCDHNCSFCTFHQENDMNWEPAGMNNPVDGKELERRRKEFWSI